MERESKREGGTPRQPQARTSSSLARTGRPSDGSSKKARTLAPENPSTGERKGQGRWGRCVTGEKTAEHVPRRCTITIASRRRLGASHAAASWFRVGDSRRLAWFRSGREEVQLCSGPLSWNGRLIRSMFDFGLGQSNSDSGPNLISFRAIPIRPDWASFRAVLGLPERGLRE